MTKPPSRAKTKLLNGYYVRPAHKPGHSHFKPRQGVPKWLVSLSEVNAVNTETPLDWLLAWETVETRRAKP